MGGSLSGYLRGSYNGNKAKIFLVVLEHTKRTKKTNFILGGSGWTLRKKPHMRRVALQ